MKYKILLTGSTGMIGKGVLFECLQNECVEKVIALNRKSLAIQHEKLDEIILEDFSQFESVSNVLPKLDACFHCMGVSALGKSEHNYSMLTFDITKTIADNCYLNNPQMVFIYVSGIGTDSSEKGRSMWARVKGKTENYIIQKGFAKSYMFRPGAILPEKGIKSRTKWYQIIYSILKPFYPIMKKLKSVTTTSKIGSAMLNAIEKSYDNVHLGNRDINLLAELTN